MWACERAVFVNGGPQNGEIYSSGRGLSFSVLLRCALFSGTFIRIVAICKFFGDLFLLLKLRAWIFVVQQSSHT